MSDTNNTFLETLGYLDGSHEVTLHVERKIGTAGDYGAWSLSGLISAGANEDLEIYIEADQNCEITIDEISLSVIRIG